SMPENLWPDFDAEPKIRTVRRVLIEAGAGLKERTRDLIRFTVVSRPGDKGKFVHDCYLDVPTLGAGYRYPFFKVTEDGDPYPVTIVGDGISQRGETAGDEQALIANLKLLF